MMRDAVNRHTPVGEAARLYMQRGELVPDEIIVKVVEQLIDGAGDKSFMFDGFPRTLPQARLLDELLAKRSCEFFRVFFMDAPRATLLNRLTGRRICSGCGTNYHIQNIPPATDGICDVCGGHLYKRQDDCEETILSRLEIYHTSTQPLIEYYEERGVLTHVNSDQDRDSTNVEFLGKLAELGQI
jgi:adenylate kinase